jgi:hypothetical protein
MSYRSLALFVAALSSAHVATADAQSVYVAPGGVYVGAGPVYVIPASPNGVPPYVAPGPAGGPAVVAPGVVAPTNGNGAQVYVVPGRANGAPPYVAPGPVGGPVVVAPGAVASPGAANGTRIYVVPAPAADEPIAAYASAGRAHVTPPAPREPASTVRGRIQAPPRAYAAGQGPRPRAAVPYNGSDRCIIYGRREYCD